MARLLTAARTASGRAPAGSPRAAAPRRQPGPRPQRVEVEDVVVPLVALRRAGRRVARLAEHVLPLRAGRGVRTRRDVVDRPVREVAPGGVGVVHYQRECLRSGWDASDRQRRLAAGAVARIGRRQPTTRLEVGARDAHARCEEVGLRDTAGPAPGESQRGYSDPDERPITSLMRARERTAAAHGLGHSRELLHALVQNASDLILIVAPDGQIRSATGATLEVLGEGPAGCQGRTLVEFVHPHDCVLLNGLMTGALAGGPGATERVGWRMLHSEGRWGDVEAVATNPLDDEHVNGLLLSCRDISASKAFEEQLRHRAFHDPLTQLPNRALLLDRIEQAMARERRTIALLFVDLDDFKVVNDTLGHAAGDALLTAVAARLRGCLRSADTAARLGGDEFALLLEEIVDPSEGERVASRVLDTMRRPFSLHGEPVHVNVSVGLVVAGAGSMSVDELLRRADFAMYAAKRNGKSRAEKFDATADAELVEQFERTAPVNDEAERVTWFARAEEQRAEIEEVLEDPATRIGHVFQPVVDLRTGLVAGFEALSRFRDSRRPPNAWFAQAHRCGLGIELEMVAARSQLSAAGRPPGSRLSINLSPSAMLSAEAEQLLVGDLSHVVLEVTEDELMADGGALEERLAELRRRGARLAVDDLGAGYAGLQHGMRVQPAGR